MTKVIQWDPTIHIVIVIKATQSDPPTLIVITKVIPLDPPIQIVIAKVIQLDATTHPGIQAPPDELVTCL